MSRGDPLLDYVPEDIVSEVMELEEKPRRRKRRLPYPTKRDISDAVIEAVKMFHGHPDEFPDLVMEILEERGFYTGFVTIRRIWRIYEELVRKRIIGDYLDVLHD